ncbi:alpha-glucosidase/alpha-galactosidase [Azotobacter chroococcum]|uniref:Alpha-galactosidase n=1 Tax=Azotobacter chroococcum NCIMB 8003 TaxID=1328314 RepID=A0A0C4WWN9_9GAMM|nr:alpha-glucosidase/alpha-galactosidase [Azotobacter chroococcum]AJE23362.1 alpha-galactosidase [Azotobacter chroococcum NCIMB 8003]ASL28414.1 alpha-galactosidase [Azotobacter chroococcum]
MTLKATKIALIGAGSTVFMKNLLGDLLQVEKLRNAHIALMDIDPHRLETSQLVAGKIAEAVGASPTFEATTDRRRALDGADYVITMIQVAGYKPGTVTDFEVPKRHGLRQTIGDTLGIGGIMRGLRTAPVLVDIAKDMRELCPNALMLQYVNPMAINCLALNRFAPEVRTVGLCHSVQGTAKELAEDIGVPIDEIRYRCAGINHMAFYLSFERLLPDGRTEDLYPRIRSVLDTGKVPDWNRVRYEVFKHFGHFVTESSEHFAEYVPWFIKRHRPDLIEQFNIPLDEYIRRCEKQIGEWGQQEQALLAGEGLKICRSHEYASQIIEAELTGKPTLINGNVMNTGLIANLPEGACVEVPCVVDHNGIQPTRIGDLPVGLAALMQTNINVQTLTVEALASGRREHVKQAAMLDPHTAAELSLDEIDTLVDELIEAHQGWLPHLR